MKNNLCGQSEILIYAVKIGKLKKNIGCEEEKQFCLPKTVLCILVNDIFVDIISGEEYPFFEEKELHEMTEGNYYTIQECGYKILVPEETFDYLKRKKENKKLSKEALLMCLYNILKIKGLLLKHQYSINGFSIDTEGIREKSYVHTK